MSQSLTPTDRTRQGRDAIGALGCACEIMVPESQRVVKNYRQHVDDSLYNQTKITSFDPPT